MKAEQETISNNLYEVAEVKLVYHNKVKAIHRPKITQSSHAYDILYSYWDKDTIALTEEFKMLMVDRQNRCMGIANISQGGTAGTIVDPKIVFPIALKARSHGLIFSHNHPSGECKPSSVDIKLTSKFQRAAHLLDITLLDHLIISPEEGHYYSFSDEEMMDNIRNFDY